MVQSVSPTVGKYTLAERVERGGPGEVYLAHHRREQVLIRFLNDLPTASPVFTQRFEAAIERLADLDHPRIIPIIGFGQQDGVPYLVTPLVVGERLTDRFARNRPRAEELPGYLRPIAEALDQAHARGLAHGDLQPANVLLDSDGTLSLIDFGVASLYAGSGITQAATPADDIAALARIAYQGLTGQAVAADATISRVVPGARALTKAIHDSTTDRFATAGDFVRDFAAELAGDEAHEGPVAAAAPPATSRPRQAPPRRAHAFLPKSAVARRVAALWVAAICVIAVIVVGAVLLLSGGGDAPPVAVAPIANQAGASVAPDRRGMPFAFPLDNELIARRYAEARGLLPEAAADGQLHRFAAECTNPRAEEDCLLVYVFYSKQADLMYNYHFKVVDDVLIGDFTEPAANDDFRIVMNELPWEKNPDWARLIKVSYLQLPSDFAPAGYSAGLVSNVAAFNAGAADWTMVYVDRAENKQYLFELLGEAVTKLPE